MPALPWKVIGWVGVYNPVWRVIQDIVKLGVAWKQAFPDRISQALASARFPCRPPSTRARAEQHLRAGLDMKLPKPTMTTARSGGDITSLKWRPQLQRVVPRVILPYEYTRS